MSDILDNVACSSDDVILMLDYVIVSIRLVQELEMMSYV